MKSQASQIEGTTGTAPAGVQVLASAEADCEAMVRMFMKIKADRSVNKDPETVYMWKRFS